MHTYSSIGVALQSVKTPRYCCVRCVLCSYYRLQETEGTRFVCSATWCTSPNIITVTYLVTEVKGYTRTRTRIRTLWLSHTSAYFPLRKEKGRSPRKLRRRWFRYWRRESRQALPHKLQPGRVAHHLQCPTGQVAIHESRKMTKKSGIEHWREKGPFLSFRITSQQTSLLTVPCPLVAARSNALKHLDATFS